ncbi:MAG TPA: dihydrolipoamide acetyltransferase family protein [Thermoflexales bacterium]|nr:dihydrolipoamide acetyltransferase family protein [Thermoflexales bacterium]HQW35082.1 dihydrolipoamide acetyltransferase family protein [Thermoflexales bacterium]HQZ23498.1 dihydrolipoamide acetyltransferase family protein [Thermoflexales bacterium]
MAKEILMPQMGFDMTDGTVAAWLKKEGEAVTKGEAIVEIETDKTTIQVEAFEGGVLGKIFVQAGEKVPVGTPIGLISAPGEAVITPAATAPVAAAPSAPATAPAQAASASVNASPVARRMAEDKGIDLSQITGTGKDGQITKADVENFAPAQKPVAQTGGRVFASPAAKVLAEQKGVDLSAVKGSGPEGRVVKADVETAPGAISQKAQPVVTQQVATQQVATQQVAAQQVAAQTSAGATSTKKMFTRMRQTIAQRMTQVKGPVPHYYVSMQVEMDAALKLREQINESLKGDGIKVSVNDLVVKASASALRKFPNFNAAFAGDGIELREQINIGIAVAMEGGLVVVTLRDADKKTLKQIGAEVPEIAKRVREGKGQAGDMGGQTFTTSNLGMYGAESVIPIINMPDSAILGIGAAAPTPVVREGQIVVRSMLLLWISGDHRVTDGAEGAQFLQEIKRLLENPWGLVL